MDDPFKIFPSLNTEDLAWISAYSKDYAESRLFVDLYCNFSGLDPRLLRRAVWYANSGDGRFDAGYGKLVSSNYKLLYHSSSMDSTRIQPLLIENALSDKLNDRLIEYGLRWLSLPMNGFSGYPEGISGSMDPERLELYMDAPLGFVLTHRGIENAISAFWAENPHTLLIHQLQGVRKKKFIGPLKVGRHHSVGLNMLDFRKAMVEIVAELARDCGFMTLGIKGAKNNAWTITDDQGIEHIPLERAFDIYDGTAMRLGFNRSRNGNWYQNL